LEKKEGCCAIFTSIRAKLSVELCKSAIKYNIDNGYDQYYTIYGKKIKQDEFMKESCSNSYTHTDTKLNNGHGF
jgi:hypothetical protein